MRLCACVNRAGVILFRRLANFYQPLYQQAGRRARGLVAAGRQFVHGHEVQKPTCWKILYSRLSHRCSREGSVVSRYSLPRSRYTSRRSSCRLSCRANPPGQRQTARKGGGKAHLDRKQLEEARGEDVFAQRHELCYTVRVAVSARQRARQVSTDGSEEGGGFVLTLRRSQSVPTFRAASAISPAR